MWSVATTASAKTFSAASALRADGVTVFLPYIKEKTRVSLPTRGRALFKVLEREVPRWPGYLFTLVGEAGQVDNELLARVRGNREVRDLVSFGGVTAMVSERFVTLMQRECAKDGRLLKKSSLHAVGDILKFISPSPFEGRRGEVVRLDDETLALVTSGRVVTTRYAEVAPIA
jgi:transcription antitermination factor NusG